MKISPYLHPNYINLNLTPQPKNNIIKEVALLLKDAPEVEDFELFLKDIYEREELSTTGIGKGIALPHARTDAVKDFIIAIGRCDQGVDFAAIDNQPVKLIFLMGTPKEKGINSYLQILAHLTRILNRDYLLSELLEADCPDKIIEIFNKVEENS